MPVRLRPDLQEMGNEPGGMNSQLFGVPEGGAGKPHAPHRPRSHSKGTGRPVWDPHAPCPWVLREPLHSPTGPQDPTAPPLPMGRQRALTGLLGEEALRLTHPCAHPQAAGKWRPTPAEGARHPEPRACALSSPVPHRRLVFLAYGTMSSGRRETTAESLHVVPKSWQHIIPIS